MSTLNIKNPETCRLVHQLAELTGESMTAAVEQAVRERLDRLQQASGEANADLIERLAAIAREAAGIQQRGGKWIADPGDVLYDERGLPGGD